MQEHFKKELLMTKKDKEDFESSTKCWICDNDYVDGNVKVRDHSPITEKCRDSAHGDCNIKVKLNHKIPTVFRSLKNYDSYLIMQELAKFDFNIKDININKKLIFIDSFQLLRSSLDNLVKNLGNDDFKRLS